MRRLPIIKLPKRIMPLKPYKPTVPSYIRMYSARDDKKSTYTLHPKTKIPCPKCKTPLPTQLPTCPEQKCGYIAPVSSDLGADYFSLFALPGVRDGEGSSRNAFSIDPRELRGRFLQMQKVCHPDRWAQKGEDEAQIAVNQSALLNKAYQTLLSPRLRGEYILSHHGIDITEMDNMDREQELMMQVMEAREELESAEGEEVKALMEANAGKYLVMMQRRSVRINAPTERVEKVTAELEDAIGREDWAQAKRSVIQLRYWESFKRAGQGMEVDH